jgi:hypothetical protein
MKTTPSMVTLKEHVRFLDVVRRGKLKQDQRGDEFIAFSDR